MRKHVPTHNLWVWGMPIETPQTRQSGYLKDGFTTEICDLEEL